MMPSRSKFRPPKVNDPPVLVHLTWVDAYGDNETDGPADTAGGLVELPRVGYFVRHARTGPFGPFVVIAAEWDRASNGKIHVRDHISIPVGWITSWSIIDLAEKRQIWPANQGSGISTSSTRASQTKMESSIPTTSEAGTSATANPNASESVTV